MSKLTNLDSESVIQFINGVGFPIVMCLALFWTNQKNISDQNELMHNFTRTIDENNKILMQVQKLIEYNNESTELAMQAIESISNQEAINNARYEQVVKDIQSIDENIKELKRIQK